MNTGQWVIYISALFFIVFLFLFYTAVSPLHSHLCSLYFIPPAEDLISQRLQQRRRSQADPLRRVLLTTQMKVRPRADFSSR